LPERLDHARGWNGVAAVLPSLLSTIADAGCGHRARCCAAGTARCAIMCRTGPPRTSPVRPQVDALPMPVQGIREPARELRRRSGKPAEREVLPRAGTRRDEQTASLHLDVCTDGVRCTTSVPG